MNPARALRRVLAMDRREIGFRLASETRKHFQRARMSVSAPRWNRSAFASLLAPAGAGETPELARCRRAARHRDWTAAHRALTAHLASRPGAFPLDPGALPGLAAHITERFPSAVPEAAARADRVLAGSFDLLGYAGLDFGSPPRWHHDPVHGREAPRGFWASVPYLQPASGDHKVIWEINRHQHFLVLARAFHLTGNRAYYRAFVAHLESWLASNPPLQGMNWASMLELAFRALSWIWALHFFAPAAQDDEDGATWSIDLLVALDRQLAHVRHNLSTYFSPNTHLSGEALALYVAGTTLPELRSSVVNARTGGDVLVQEAERQIRADGGHAELSAHYHRYSTDFYLLSASVARHAGDARELVLRDAALRQAQYLRVIADDSGRLPLIGDDDGGQLFPICGRRPVDCRDTLATAAVLFGRPDLQIGETPEEVYWLCATRVPVERLDRPAPPALPPASTPLWESGYFVIRGRGGDHLVFDAGPHGYLNGGHAHADALSVVLTVGGVPLLVDPGTATYTMDPRLRDLFRSSAMHNTVVVDGRPQSLPRGPFHWATRASAHAPVWRAESAFTCVEGQHDGYFPAMHRRVVMALDKFGWIVIDHLLGSGTFAAEAFWHLHPDWSVIAGAGESLVLQHRTGRLSAIAASRRVQKISATEGAGLDLYAPEYGRVERAATLRMPVTGKMPLSFATVVPAAAIDPEVESLPLATAPPAGWHGAAFRIAAGGTQLEVLSAVEADGTSAGPNGGPDARWGTESTMTDARLAAGGDGVPDVLVHGTYLDRRLAPPVHHRSAGHYGRA